MRNSWIASVSFLCATRLTAQATGPLPCKSFPTTPDTIQTIVQADVSAVEFGRKIDSKESRILLSAIVANVTLPSALSLPVFDASPTPLKRGQVGYAYPQFTGSVYFRISDTGHLVASPMVGIPSMTPGIEAVLLNAVRMADSTDALTVTPKRLRNIDLSFELFVDDTTHDFSVELGRSKTAVFRVTRKVDVPHGNRGPLYPEQLRQQGLEGNVLAYFIVAESGFVVPGSVKIQKFSHLAFETSARRYLATNRYLPAVAGGCPVNAVVQQTFMFRLDR